MTGRAFIAIDVQNDFCPGGSLAVPDGDAVVEPLNEMLQLATHPEDVVIATRDWHPADATKHFDTWPAHCVQNTEGAKFHPDLIAPSIGATCTKGYSRDSDDYSAFAGKMSIVPSNSFMLSLDRYLTNHEIKRLYVGGLATDYCVKETVLEALRLRYDVTVLEDACRAVTEETGAEAIKAMEQRGATFSTVEVELAKVRHPSAS